MRRYVARLGVESLEERSSPSALLFNGNPDPPLEAPPLLAAARAADQHSQLPTALDACGAALTVCEESGLVIPVPELGLASLRQFGANKLVPGELEGEQTPSPDHAGTPAPVIVEFSASEGPDGWWTFEGRVEAPSPRGLTVYFGGLPSLEGQTAPVDEDGGFRLTIQLQRTPVCEGGVATAQTEGWDGQLSNVIEDYVRQTNCPE